MSGENAEPTVSDGRAAGECKSAPTAAEPSAVLIYSTFPSQGEAENTARYLVEHKLAACVNIFPGMIAVFSWEGKTDRAEEVAVLIKTAAARTNDVLDAIKRLHPYSVPARLVLPVAGGGADFLAWIAAETARSAE